jgi:hypothetical protein
VHEPGGRYSIRRRDGVSKLFGAAVAGPSLPLMAAARAGTVSGVGCSWWSKLHLVSKAENACIRVCRTSASASASPRWRMRTHPGVSWKSIACTFFLSSTCNVCACVCAYVCVCVCVKGGGVREGGSVNIIKHTHHAHPKHTSYSVL